MVTTAEQMSRKRPISEKPPEFAGIPPTVNLKEIFKAPGEGSYLDVNNPWTFRSWWNTIQAQDSSDYIVSLFLLLVKIKALL